MDIEVKDNRNSTPLHWACFSCSELALIYILSWLREEQLAAQDIDGYTALHLAIRSAEELESSRPVRALMFANAPTDIKDNMGNVPLDILKEVKSE